MLPPRRAYTLLEVILALGLAVVVLGLVGMGIHLHLAVAAKSRDQVEEAQLARVLLQRISDDLRNAIPFQPATSSGDSSLADTSGTSGLETSSGTSDSSDSTSLSGGIYGTAQAIQIETARRPRATLASMQAQTARDSSQPAPLSDIRVVSYSLGAPSSVDMSKETSASTSLSGLYRHEQDRAEFVYGSQNGQVDESNPATELLAPEVVNLQLTYYDGTTTGGTATSSTTTSDQWDSNQTGKLPGAVKISISLRREAPKSMSNVLDNESRPAVVYSLLVSLPNASVNAGSRASQQAASNSGGGGSGSGGGAGGAGEVGSGGGGPKTSPNVSAPKGSPPKGPPPSGSPPAAIPPGAGKGGP